MPLFVALGLVLTVSEAAVVDDWRSRGWLNLFEFLVFGVPLLHFVAINLTPKIKRRPHLPYGGRSDMLVRHCALRDCWSVHSSNLICYCGMDNILTGAVGMP